jgi:tryptophan synthase alpha chain
MQRIRQLFQRKPKGVLNVYCTAGYPALHSTLEVMQALQDNGADIIELGMPYSDPLADGPVIQQSSAIALQNGMTLHALFAQLKDMRRTIHIPVVLMGYMNPILQYGFDAFCRDAVAAGVDGLILPDLPEYEFETLYGPLIQKAGLDFIFLVTPETSPVRVKKLDGLSSGFLYAVSSSSTTGNEQDMQLVASYLDRLKGYNLTNPVLVGFGIKDRTSYLQACEHAAGAIIGSAFIRCLDDKREPMKETIARFLKSILS